MLRRLTPFRQCNIHEQRWGCIHQISIIGQLLETRQTHRGPTIVVFLHLKGAFDSVDWIGSTVPTDLDIWTSSLFGVDRVIPVILVNDMLLDCHATGMTLPI